MDLPNPHYRIPGVNHVGIAIIDKARELKPGMIITTRFYWTIFPSSTSKEQALAFWAVQNDYNRLLFSDVIITVGE